MIAWDPSEIIPPQLGVGGFTPSPIKLRNASNEMYRGIARLSATTIGPRMFGKTCRKRIDESRDPIETAASMYSFWRIDNTWPRANRAVSIQDVKPTPM